ncbi:unnamed protein product [Allacma fusca]|uniref:Uncharacterized protein n=1 Tax=Allacma fusca TaxID=39272 RepID=A0A8J2JF06_9HEXA|nr:unnamed protein product [Allacma fusca]
MGDNSLKIKRSWDKECSYREIWKCPDLHNALKARNLTQHLIILKTKCVPLESFSGSVENSASEIYFPESGRIQI